MPIGTIITFMGTMAPQDYLACDGATYNITDYPELAAFFEAQFGTKNNFGGDGTTTFKVPDLRGEFLRGTGTNSHSDQGSGANVGVHQDGTKHPNAFAWGNNQIIVPAEYNVTGQAFNSRVYNSDSYKNRVANIVASAVSAGGASTEELDCSNYTSRPTNTSILYCIKAVSYK